jgi:GNAT superfamily N-acetyltransferase
VSTAAASATWGDLYVDLYAARFRRLAAAGETRRAPGALAVAGGPVSNTDNGVVSSRDELPDGIVEELVAWFAQRRLPASWLHGGGPVGDELRGRLLSAGCREEVNGIDMGVDLGELAAFDRAAPLDVRIDEVCAPSDVDAWLDVAGACGWFDDERDRDARRRLYLALGLGGDRPIRHWVARRDGRAVGLATAFFDADAVLLEHLAVLPDERRHGIGTALALVRIREAINRRCRFAVLAPSPDGELLYRTLGFTKTATPPRRWFYLPLDR